MNTKHIGDISEAKIIASLLASGRTVLKPVGDNQRFDLVLFDDPKFLRVQVKTGRIDSFNSVRFSVCSLSSKNVGALTYKSHHVSYKGQVELFGVYCPDNDRCYLVPIEHVGGRECSLKLSPPETWKSRAFKLASDFEIH